MVIGPSEEDNLTYIEALAKMAEGEVIKIDFDDLIAETEKFGWDEAVDAALAKAEKIAQEKNCHVFLVFENVQKLESTRYWETNEKNPKRKSAQMGLYRRFHSEYSRRMTNPKITYVHVFFTLDYPWNMERAIYGKCEKFFSLESLSVLPNSRQRQTIIIDELKAAGQKPIGLFWLTLLSTGYSRTGLQRITKEAIEKAQKNNNTSAASTILRQELWNQISPEKKAFIGVGVTVVAVAGIAGLSMLGYKVGKWLIPMKNQNINVAQIQVKKEVIK